MACVGVGAGGGLGALLLSHLVSHLQGYTRSASLYGGLWAAFKRCGSICSEQVIPPVQLQEGGEIDIFLGGKGAELQCKGVWTLQWKEFATIKQHTTAAPQERGEGSVQSLQEAGTLWLYSPPSPAPPAPPASPPNLSFINGWPDEQHLAEQLERQRLKRHWSLEWSFCPFSYPSHPLCSESIPYQRNLGQVLGERTNKHGPEMIQ